MKKSLLVLTVLTAVLTAISANAVLLTYDDFATKATNDNSSLSQSTNGFGWLGSWVVQGAANYGYAITNAPTMGYVDGGAKILLTNGMLAVGGDAYTSSGRRLPVSQTYEPPTVYNPYRKITYNQYGGTEPMIGADGTELWFSALVRQQANNNSYALQLTPQGVAWVPNGNPRIQIGLNGGVWELLCADTNGVTYTASTGVSRTLNQTYLMVMRMAFADGNDVVDLFVDPPQIGGLPPVTPSASVTSTNDLYFRTFRFYPGSGQNNGYVDEVRIGETYADVTPAIPEPAIGLVLAGLVLALRKR